MTDKQPTLLSDTDADEQTSAAWHVDDGMLTATFQTGTMLRGLVMVNAVVEAAEDAQHHPDIDLRYPVVTYRLTTHDVGQLTSRDTALAARIDQIAADQEITADEKE